MKRLLPDQTGSQDFAHEQHTKAPEGTVVGVSAGGVVGGVLGFLSGIGAFVIPGLGAFVAAGPLMGALSGAAAGAAVGGVTGAAALGMFVGGPIMIATGVKKRHEVMSVKPKPTAHLVPEGGCSRYSGSFAMLKIPSLSRRVIQTFAATRFFAIQAIGPRSLSGSK